ncbi:MBL fold metallo-hydrolase [Chryseobacterium capnotolerans]|uniref:MBL fold metallo-hydrolase n=1 Tax=Chryseobacterium TaxID=59732 RepID=UPI00083A398B|nr:MULTISPECIES: MBL fold metallo-hydrolase [Chryseobacterium]UHO40151.1 MBL fold metallo-hydrolase [Chryseobacterium capnotolerans]
MKLQLWRNATLLLNMDGTSILIDPMLGEKGSLGKFPMTDNELLNPLLDLPFSKEVVVKKLQEIDAVAITHLHPDHWDSTAMELIDKTTTIFCPSAISDQIEKQGFQNIITINDHVLWNSIDISITKGQHGTGEIGDKMGIVNGFVFKKDGQSVYIVGDSIWYDDIAKEIDKHQPKHIIVAGGAAAFSVGDPIIMTSEDIIKVCEYAPGAKIWVTHLEAVSHCKEDRKFIQENIDNRGYGHQCFIPKDGEEIDLSFD